MKAHGERGASKEINGIQYHQYTYQRNAPEEVVTGSLSATDTLPGIWTLSELEDDGRVIRRTISFGDLEANGNLPDSLFHLPGGLSFQE